jgi:hypothetical protein
LLQLPIRESFCSSHCADSSAHNPLGFRSTWASSGRVSHAILDQSLTLCQPSIFYTLDTCCMSGNLVKKLISVLFASTLLALPATPANASQERSARGPVGQTLSISIPPQGLSKSETTMVTIKGQGYRPRVGIYVTFCVLPKRGQKPEYCGSYNPLGINSQARWISSNPPAYAAILATKFGPRGSFEVTLPIRSMIGDQDCTKVRCAIATRADHTRPNLRRADVFIPVTFN